MFDLKDFIRSPSGEKLEGITKIDWIVLARYYNVEVSESARKQEISNKVSEALMNLGILSDKEALLLMNWEKEEADSQQSASDNNTEDSTSEEEGAKAVREKTKSLKVKPKKSKLVYEGMSVEQMQIHLQIVRLGNEKAVELKRLEAEVEQKRIELEIKKIEVEGKSKVALKSFQVDNAVKSVPIFVENEVDSFFLQFEKVAEQREWPRTSWSTLVQTSFRGKAREVFAALSLDDSKDYERVKSEVLKAYEWVPERYRVKFRSWIKRDGHTHMEYAREQRLWYDRWINAREVNGDFGKLQELILLEQFKDGINPLIKTYLDERDVDNVVEATRLSDNYALTHKLYHTDVTPKIGRNRVWEERQNYKAQGKTTSSQVSSGGVYNKSFNRGFRGASQNSYGPSVSAGKAGSSGNDQFTPRYQNVGENFRDFVCFSCGKPGHISRSCPHRTENRPIQVVNKVKDKPVHSKKDDHKPENTIALLNQPQACGDISPCLFASPLRPGKSYCNNSINNNVCNVDENIGYKMGNNCVQNVNNVGYVETNVKENRMALPEESTKSKGTELYDPFMGEGWLHLPCVEKKKVRWLRDTGAVQSVMVRNMYDQWKDTGEYVLLRGFGPEFSAPLVEVKLETPLISGFVKIALVREIPVSGVELILGNDLCGNKVFGSSNPILTEKPSNSSSITEVECTFPNIFPACAVTTRSKSTEGKVKDDDGLDLQNLFKDSPETQVSKVSTPLRMLKVNKEEFVKSQIEDENLKVIRDNALVDINDIEKEGKCYFVKDGILMRKFKSRNVNDVVEQVIIPNSYKNFVLGIAHDSSYSGHLGINKTYEKLLRYFYWPKMHKDCSEYCKNCDLCQKVGKAQHDPKVMPLQPIEVPGEPFERLVLDCVGPLPRSSKGNEYLLTIMCSATRFPEAIPLRTVSADKVIEALNKFFSLVGLPKEVQTDQGTNFTSKKFKSFLACQNIKHCLSSPYHPQSQGVVERFHRTFKTMLRTYCCENEKEWDVFIPMLLFAVRDSVHSSLGYSPFQLVYVHQVRSPMEVIKNKLISDEKDSITLQEMKEKIKKIWKVAHENLEMVQEGMKRNYDKKAAKRELDIGDKVLVYLPTSDHPKRIKGIQHKIRLREETPISQRPYRMSPRQQQQLKTEVAYLLKHGLAEESHSEWASPCILVDKPDGSARMCTDYRKVNNVTIKDSYPMPRVEDIIDNVAKFPFLSKIDLLKGYYQIELDKDSRNIAAFVTPHGLYNYKVMPFGLCNAPLTFQRQMNYILKDLEGVFVYLDDIIIVGETWEDHIKKVYDVFKRLLKFNVTINLAKCEFGKTTVQYLGHGIGSGHVRPVDCHIEVIKNLTIPASKRGVMKFLGTVGYYRKFCENFSDVAYPLTELLKKDVKFVWSKECDEAFSKLKFMLMSKPVLKSPDFNLPFKLQVDSSEVGAGSVLLQEHDGITRFDLLKELELQGSDSRTTEITRSDTLEELNLQGSRLELLGLQGLIS
ncbi:uncharacterized protein [Palaemon carinicauda]|uniref:uncharacterized protein n=1 Tax=Palaemon carinicauda TaxID=392227 RepID=UPI0035B6052D